MSGLRGWMRTRGMWRELTNPMADQLRPPSTDAEDIEVKPGTTLNVPLPLAHLSYISVRPSANYQYSKPRFITELAKQGPRSHVRCDDIEALSTDDGPVLRILDSGMRCNVFQHALKS